MKLWGNFSYQYNGKIEKRFFSKNLKAGIMRKITSLINLKIYYELGNLEEILY